MIKLNLRSAYLAMEMKTGPLRRDASQMLKIYRCTGWNVRRFALELQENPIDIAIDLSGYTDNGCPELFASRLAPIQISFLGYPSTMGADFIDFLWLTMSNSEDMRPLF